MSLIISNKPSLFLKTLSDQKKSCVLATSTQTKELYKTQRKQDVYHVRPAVRGDDGGGCGQGDPGVGGFGITPRYPGLYPLVLLCSPNPGLSDRKEAQGAQGEGEEVFSADGEGQGVFEVREEG